MPSVAEPIREELAQGATSNTNNLLAKEHKIFVTKAEVEALVRHEKKKVFSTAMFLILKQPYPASIIAKPGLGSGCDVQAYTSLRRFSASDYSIQSTSHKIISEGVHSTKFPNDGGK